MSQLVLQTANLILFRLLIGLQFSLKNFGFLQSFFHLINFLFDAFFSLFDVSDAILLFTEFFAKILKAFYKKPTTINNDQFKSRHGLARNKMAKHARLACDTRSSWDLTKRWNPPADAKGGYAPNGGREYGIHAFSADVSLTLYNMDTVVIVDDFPFFLPVPPLSPILA
uniref:Uncharacterized protein n=1 Tax=Romanomermis culicivorax TaxID=13658 RepID=A0A915IT83_ROMCU